MLRQGPKHSLKIKLLSLIVGVRRLVTRDIPSVAPRPREQRFTRPPAGSEPSCEDGRARAHGGRWNPRRRRCDARGGEPRDAALFAVLDLVAGLIAFNGVRSLAELAAWRWAEAPARAGELARMNGAVAADFPPCIPTCTPRGGVWH
jgi:hypothetical protein